jgi:hypothetical protein
MFNTPILFIIFKRLDTAKQVFSVIRQIQPAHLFIAADGPRTTVVGEEELCNTVRQYVLDTIDWDCEIKTLFRDKNLGCGKGPAESITWFFDQVDRGIILEDDCIPNISCFNFMEELLSKYENDTRIMQISGTNRLVNYATPFSYIFSNYPSEWGWATWRRAWNLYDFNISFFKENNIKSKEILKHIFYKTYWYEKIYKIFEDTINNPDVSWWDYQWGFIKYVNYGLTIVPRKNLVANIGFDENATHTTNSTSEYNNMPQFNIDFPLIHPDYVYPDMYYDSLILDKHFHKEPTIIRKYIKKMKRIINLLWK